MYEQEVIIRLALEWWSPHTHLKRKDVQATVPQCLAVRGDLLISERVWARLFSCVVYLQPCFLFVNQSFSWTTLPVHHHCTLGTR